MSGQITSDPLFVGLTRPAMIFGVSLQYAMLNMLVSIVAFIQTSDIRVVLLAAVLHLIGYVMCFKEPLFLEIWLNKISKTSQCPNKTYYGANSYSI